MIITAILNIIYIFVLGIVLVIEKFGTVSPNNNITEAISTISGYVVSLNDYLPLTTLFAIIVFDLTFELAFFTYKIFRWGYKKVPGIS